MTKTANASALPSAARTFYEANAVAEDIKSQLEETAMFLISVSRRSTEETFKLGEHLERAAELLPDGTLEKWAVERCGIPRATSGPSARYFATWMPTGIFWWSWPWVPQSLGS